MKLTLEHLGPYLPYGLKWKVKSKLFYTAYMSTKRIALISPSGNGEVFKFPWDNLPKNIKPILRPLSDLTKEIEVNKHKFIPLEVLNLNINAKYDRPYINKKQAGFVYGFAAHKVINLKNINHNSYWHITRLLEWHFDIFSLLDNNLAININES
jgi:hypothetical protein